LVVLPFFLSLCCGLCDGRDYYESEEHQGNFSSPYADASAPYAKHDPEVPIATSVAVVQPTPNTTSAVLPTEKQGSEGTTSPLKSASAIASNVGSKIGSMLKREPKLKEAQIF